MTVWNTSQYLKFSNERLRPALDLMAQISLENPKKIVDLGCGPGNVTALLAERFPYAHVTGLDSSPEMLAKAKTTAALDWQEGDIATWRPEGLVSLIFSNAALHWVRDHGQVFSNLMDTLEKKGQLLVQMPHNHASPSHQCIVQTVKNGPWEERLSPLLANNRIEEPSFYYDLLSAQADVLDIWESEYLHVLEGENPVVEWTKGTALKGFLDALTEESERNAFLDQYALRTAKAYPPQPNGKTLLPFRRLFIQATKG